MSIEAERIRQLLDNLLQEYTLNEFERITSNQSAEEPSDSVKDCVPRHAHNEEVKVFEFIHPSQAEVFIALGNFTSDWEPNGYVQVVDHGYDFEQGDWRVTAYAHEV